jgi:hypothetical protein
MATMLRPKQIYGKGGRLPVGRTKFDSDYVFHEGGEEFVPGTRVPRLRLVHLGPRSVAGFEDELDALLEGLRAERDAKQFQGAGKQRVQYKDHDNAR